LTSGYKLKAFLLGFFVIAQSLGSEVNYDFKKWKLKIKKIVEEGEVNMTVNLLETEKGLKVAEFIKKSGPLMEFYDICNNFEEGFEKLYLEE